MPETFSSAECLAWIAHASQPAEGGDCARLKKFTFHSPASVSISPRVQRSVPPQALGWSGRHPDEHISGFAVPKLDANRSSFPQSSDPGVTSFTGCILEITPTVGGLCALCLLGLLILKKPSWTFGITDLLYGLTVVAMLGAKYWTIHRLDAPGIDDAKGPWTKLRSYAFVLLGSSGAGWLGAQLLQI